MSRNVLIALLLMILSVLVMIFNHPPVSVNLLFTTVKAYAGLVYLSFTVVGVVIGVLLK
jgi:uncharacterized integral membrane protein